MIVDAIRDIRLAEALDARRREELALRRQSIRTLDVWLQDIESLLERNRRTVPEPLVREIATFVRGVSPKLHRSLLRNREREASRVLDILFGCQEHLMPGEAGEDLEEIAS